jgi:serine protease Do
MALLSATLCLGMTVSSQPVWAQGAPLVRGLPDFTELVDVVGPSVVNIRTLE